MFYFFDKAHTSNVYIITFNAKISKLIITYIVKNVSYLKKKLIKVEIDYYRITCKSLCIFINM